MPYVNTQEVGTKFKIDEDNLIDGIGDILISAGWTKAKNFYKAVVDTRAYHKKSKRINYAFAKHEIYRNAEGKLLGLATVANYSYYYKLDGKVETIRRPHDEKDPEDDNYGIQPAWDIWAKQQFYDNVQNTALYAYTCEKLPSDTSVPNGSIISTVVQPGMSDSRVQPDRDQDKIKRVVKYSTSTKTSIPSYSALDDDEYDTEFVDRYLTASPEFVTEQALDIEVHQTKWYKDGKVVEIEFAEPRIMQSPIHQMNLRADHLEYVSNPLYYTNWWTDSEIALEGYVDSTSLFFVLQCDTVPNWEQNVVPSIPFYFGKLDPIKEGDNLDTYVMFVGTTAPTTAAKTERGTTLSARVTSRQTILPVVDPSAIPQSLPALMRLGSKELIVVNEIQGNNIIVERGYEDTFVAHEWKRGTSIRSDVAILDTDPSALISKFDYDNPNLRIDSPFMPITKTYPKYPSTGADSVMVFRSKLGGRYQAHYLSWGTPNNTMPPTNVTSDFRKYPDAYDSLENATHYKYQFNPSRYSERLHTTPIYVVHPEAGVIGSLKFSLGVTAQSIRATMLREEIEHCSYKLAKLYKPFTVSAYSPLTKKPATACRPVCVGILKEIDDSRLKGFDWEKDNTPPAEVTNLKAESLETATLTITWKNPNNTDFSHVNIYVGNELYATGVSNVTSYIIGGLTSLTTPTIKVKTVDMSGNESAGATAPNAPIK